MNLLREHCKQLESCCCSSAALLLLLLHHNTGCPSAFAD
jgi:hypothetical protein